MSFRKSTAITACAVAFATLSLLPHTSVRAQGIIPELCTELPPPSSIEELTASLALMAYDRKGETRQKYSKDERAALQTIVQHIKSLLPVPPTPRAPTTSSRFVLLDTAKKTYMPVMSPEVSFTLDELGTVSGIEFAKRQPGTVADTLFADVLRRIALDAKLLGIAPKFGEKSVRLALFTIFGRDPAGPKLAWAQVPFYQQDVPLYTGTDAKPMPRSLGPQYPESLRNSRTNGEAVAKFVINADGTVPRSSIRILRATDPLFGDAVRVWLSSERFMPATIKGCPVESTVVLPNTFRIHY